MGNDDEFMDVSAVCTFWGGTKPIHPATLYRGIKAGRYPPPAEVGPNTRRWLRSEQIARRDAIVADRKKMIVQST